MSEADPILIEILRGLLRKGHDIQVYIEEAGVVRRTLVEVEVTEMVNRPVMVAVFHYYLNNDQFVSSRHTCPLESLERQVTLQPGQVKTSWLLSITKEPTP